MESDNINDRIHGTVDKEQLCGHKWSWDFYLPVAPFPNFV